MTKTLEFVRDFQENHFERMTILVWLNSCSTVRKLILHKVYRWGRKTGELYHGPMSLTLPTLFRNAVLLLKIFNIIFNIFFRKWGVGRIYFLFFRNPSYFTNAYIWKFKLGIFILFTIFIYGNLFFLKPAPLFFGTRGFFSTR